MDCSLKRLCYLAGSTAGVAVQMMGRVSKPMNPLLGETYELVTPKFRFMGETVSHHPPVFAVQMQGDGFESSRVCSFTQRFTGK